MPGAAPIAGILLLAFAFLAPGLVYANFGKRCEGPSRTWILILATSPFFLTSITALLVFGAGVSLALACQVTAWGIFVGLVLQILSARRGRSETTAREDARSSESAWWMVVPVLGLVVLATVVLLPPGARLSYHGLMHAGVAAQIGVGVIPPDDVTLAGAPLGYYWLYHWLLAVHTQLSGFSILITSAVLNVVSIAIYVGATYTLLRRVAGPLASSFGSLTAGFLGSIFLPLLFLTHWMSTGLPQGAPFWPRKVFKEVLLGGDPRLVSLTSKFLNMSGFPIGLAICALLLTEMAPGGRRRPRASVILIGLSSLILFHTSTALAAYVAFSLAHFSTSVESFRHTNPRQLLRANLPMASVFVAGLVITSPYLLQVASASGSTGGMFSIGPDELFENLESIFLLATPLLPVLLIGAYRSWKDATTRFFFVAGVVLLGMGLLLPLPGANEYKFTYLSFLPIGVLLFCILRPGEGTGRRWMRAGVLGLACGLAILTHAVTAHAYMITKFRTRGEYAGDGVFLALAEDRDLDGAMHWLRANSPLDAVVVYPPVTFNESFIAATSGRAAYVLKGSLHSGTGGEHRRRMKLVRQLYDARAGLERTARDIVETLDRQLYVLVTREMPMDTYERVVLRFQGAPEIFHQEYSGAGVALFRFVRE